jgi:hypothetical protein
MKNEHLGLVGEPKAPGDLMVFSKRFISREVWRAPFDALRVAITFCENQPTGRLVERTQFILEEYLIMW